jgi:hypothetical protein
MNSHSLAPSPSLRSSLWSTHCHRFSSSLLVARSGTPICFGFLLCAGLVLSVPHCFSSSFCLFLLCIGMHPCVYAFVITPLSLSRFGSRIRVLVCCALPLSSLSLSRLLLSTRSVVLWSRVVSSASLCAMCVGVAHFGLHCPLLRASV